MIPEFALDDVSLIPGSNPMYGLNTLGGALLLLQSLVYRILGKLLEVSFGSFNRKKIDVSIGGEFADEMAGITFYLQVILMNLVGGIIPMESLEYLWKSHEKY